MRSAFDQKRANAREGRAAAGGQRVDALRFEQVGALAQRYIVLFDVLGKCRDPRIRIGDRSALMCGRDGTCQFLDQCFVDPARVSEKIERLGFVEAAHFERPFNG